VRLAVATVLAGALFAVACGQDRSTRDGGDRATPSTPVNRPPDVRPGVRNMGLNYPWVDDHQGRVLMLWMRDYRSQLVEDDLETIATLGVRVIRVFAPLEGIMSYGEAGFTLVEERADNVDRLLESAARRGLQVILVMADGNVQQRPADLDGKFRWELVQSSDGRQALSAACAAYVRRFRKHDNVRMWELANEPYGNLTWAAYPQQLNVSRDETHDYLRAAYAAAKPLTAVPVGFSDLHEEQQEKYRLFTDPESRRRYIDDATDVYSIHIYRSSPREVPDFADLTGKPKWCSELGSYNYFDETGVAHAGQPARGELWDEHQNLQAVTTIVPKLLESGFELVLPWAFTSNEGMVVHGPDGSHELKSLPQWLRSRLLRP
jgi:hypothetical protein